jgi:hypothetical protein
VLFGDATRDELDPDALALRSLELFATRSGMRTVTLPVTGVAGLGEVLGAFGPQVVVIAGEELRDDDVARWAYRVRATSGALPVLLFRRGGRDDRPRTTGARHLPASPTQAVGLLVDVLETGGRGALPVDQRMEADDAAAQGTRRRRMSA